MNEELRALVIDDDRQLRKFVSRVLGENGWNINEASSAEKAFEMLHDHIWSLVLCDVMLGGKDGYHVLRQFRKELPDTPVVLMTGHSSGVGALDATTLGAFDYLSKPFGVGDLELLSRSIREHLATRAVPARVALDKSPDPYTSDIEMVGQSKAFIEIMKVVGRVAGTDLPVLVTGESGTGKELIASALHRRSLRSEGPFVAVNCGAIPADLIESELFGHVKGSFTGAHVDRAGLWEKAHGGTILLDEITDTTANFQVKLLRALQEGEIRRVGSNETRRLDVRIIAASNRNVKHEIEMDRFRPDLFYRLNAVTIHLPPLRERTEDIMTLAQNFAKQPRSGKPSVSFSPEAQTLLERYPWPGNIRELENAVARAVALCSGTVRPQDLPDQILSYQISSGASEPQDVNLDEPQTWLSLAEVEADHVRRVLDHTKGNKQAAIRLLKIDRKTIERMIKRHDINIRHNIEIK
ncbi:MAG: two-component system, NtrC family, response regulator [Blastocatellia bacterium]|nr:two-component system, NtrC family, response regulator [Blastocatellia bacterium]